MADFSGMIKAIKDWAVSKFLTEIPIGSGTVVGGVKADGTTTTIDSDGTIHASGGGGGTGTTDYNDLSNKPSIGGVTLSGNKTLSDLGIQPEGNFVTEEELEQKGFITGISKEDVTEALGYTPPEQDTTYEPETLGLGYGLCYTAENVLGKKANILGYELVINGFVAIKFSNAVPADSTMEINGKSARAIFFKGSAITDGIIGAGDVALFVYDGGSYRLIAVDKALAPEFTEASERTNISSGEALSAIFGKVMKWFADLKPHAFVAPITNLLTTVAGSALDATMGTELNNKISANATAIEEVNSSLSEIGTYEYNQENEGISCPSGTTVNALGVTLTPGKYLVVANCTTTVSAAGSVSVKIQNASWSALQGTQVEAGKNVWLSTIGFAYVGGGTKDVFLGVWHNTGSDIIAKGSIYAIKLN